ncbi:MAG TPA: class I SAM-dependent methyltransferase [Clostridia bacterium]|nr:class I SAM-dependent methyltransferase [Clostridia bacterium]
MYSDQELASLYPQNYYAYQDLSRRASRYWEILKSLLGMRTGTKDPNFSSPGRILDVGCGTGWFLANMRARGWDTYGVEISSEAARIGRQTAELNIKAGTIFDAGFAPNFFDYVRSNHSFEHMSRPNETLKELHRILKPSGKLLIGVPNIEGANARFFRHHWWYLCAPVHTFHYSPRTLSQLLSKHGFAVEKVTYNSDYSGLLGSFQIWLNRNSKRTAEQGWAYNNKFLRFGAQRIARAFDLFGLGDVIEITARKADQL